MDEAAARDELRVPERGELAEPRAEHEDALGARGRHVLLHARVAAEAGHSDELRVVLGEHALAARRAHHGGAGALRDRRDLARGARARRSPPRSRSRGRAAAPRSRRRSAGPGARAGSGRRQRERRARRGLHRERQRQVADPALRAREPARERRGDRGQLGGVADPPGVVEDLPALEQTRGAAGWRRWSPGTRAGPISRGGRAGRDRAARGRPPSARRTCR